MLTTWYLNNGIDFWNTPDFLRKFSSKQTCHEKFNVILNYHLNKMTQWGNYKFYLWKFQERSQTSWLQRLFPLLFAFPDKLFLVNTSKLPNMPQATKLANSDLKTNTKTDTICICICTYIDENGKSSEPHLKYQACSRFWFNPTPQSVFFSSTHVEDQQMTKIMSLWRYFFIYIFSWEIPAIFEQPGHFGAQSQAGGGVGNTGRVNLDQDWC